MATEVPPCDPSPVPNPNFKVLGTTSTMVVTTVGGGRSKKNRRARVVDPPSPVPQMDGGPPGSHKKGKTRPPYWGPTIKGTGPTLEELFGPDWLKSKGSS